MSIDEPTDDELFVARANLTRFIRHRADQTRAERGFGWVGEESAPSTYQQLRGAYQESERSGSPLPVSSLDCDSTIFLTPDDTIQSRFIQAVHHIRFGLSFDLPDRWELAIWHLQDLAQFGFGRGTLEYRLLQADVIGPIVVAGILDRFPYDQGLFTRTCAEVGLHFGIFHEIRRVQ